MAIDGVSPVDSGQGVVSTTIGIFHGQQCGEIMLFGVTRIHVIARQPKLPPKLPFFDDKQSVSLSQNEKLRSNSKVLERNLRQHDVLATRVVPPRQIRIFRDDLDKALVVRLSGQGVEELPGGVTKERIIHVLKRVERDTRLGDESEVEIERVVDESIREEAARGGDQSRGSPFGSLGRDESVFEERV